MPALARRIALTFAVAGAGGALGCVTDYHAGAQFAAQKGGPVTQSGSFGVAAAFGDGDGALGVLAEGSVGVDDRGGHRVGTAVTGFEYSTWGGEPKTAHRFALLGGVTSTSGPGGLVAPLFFRYSHAWAIGDTGDHHDLTSLSLDPSLGLAVGEDSVRVLVGLGLTLRWEDFSAWHFHM